MIPTSKPKSAPYSAPAAFPRGPVYHTYSFHHCHVTSEEINQYTSAMPTTAPAAPHPAASIPAIPIGRLKFEKCQQLDCKCIRNADREGESQSFSSYPPSVPPFLLKIKCSSMTITMNHAVQ